MRHEIFNNHVINHKNTYKSVVDAIDISLLLPIGVQISNIPPGGIILFTPGIYCLTNDINWNPNPGAVAITTIGSDITIDLCTCRNQKRWYFRMVYRWC